MLSTFLIGIFINYPAIIEASTTLHTQTNVLNKSKMRTIIISVLVLLCITDISKAQKPYIKDATVEEQLEFVEKEASKWQNYIMVFDTWFRQLKNNVNNTISEKNEVISRLETTIVSKDSTITELNRQLELTASDLKETLKEKNSFSFLGISMAKGVFLSIVIFIFIILIAATALAILVLQRNNLSTSKIRKELEKTREEFEEHRQRARQKYEALVVQHHKELQRLKEG